MATTPVDLVVPVDPTVATNLASSLPHHGHLALGHRS